MTSSAKAISQPATMINGLEGPILSKTYPPTLVKIRIPRFPKKE